MTLNFRLAVKAFIVQDGKILLIRRRSNDVHKPGAWDIPGGRLEPGENPLTGVQREALEETGLKVEPIMPLDVHHFTRDDGQLITMIIFCCRTRSKKIKLSVEHQQFQWLALRAAMAKLPEWLRPVVKKFKRYIKH